jgi:hypothetical protein
MTHSRPNAAHMSGKKVQNDRNKLNELQRSSATTMLSSTQPAVTSGGGEVGGGKGGEEKETGIGFVVSRLFDIDLKNPKTLIPIAIAGAVVGFLILGA